MTLESAAGTTFTRGQSLSIRITMTFLALLLAIVGMVYFILQNTLQTQIIEDQNTSTNEISQKVIAQLGQLTLYAEGIADALAQLGSSLPNQDQVLMNSIPKIMDDHNATSVIAGGGIWPEPFAFHLDRERASFFWGREENGTLKQYDDYNDPQGPGYHNEEWYTPAKFIKNNQAIWSQSYMDPYSYEPMVTCTVPYYRDGQFSGVSTIDLKLDGLHAFFSDQAQQINGYMFAVDRNNRFLSFPQKNLAKSFATDQKGKQTERFLLVNELANTHPSFKTIADALTQLNAETLSAQEKLHNNFETTAQLLDEHSYQISKQQSTLLAAHILNEKTQSFKQQYQNVKQLYTASDPLLKQEMRVCIYHMPQTDWKIVVATPVHTAHAIAQTITNKILYYLLAAVAICIIAGYLLLRRQIITPLHSMTHILMANERQESNGTQLQALPVNRRDELGHLAHWYNRSTDAIRIANDELTKENKARTRIEEELRQANQKTIQSLQSLRKNEASLASILNSISNGVIATDIDGNIIRCNPLAEKLSAWRNPQNNNCNVRDILLVYDLNDHDMAISLDKHRDSEHNKFNCLLKNRRKDEYTIHLQISPLYDAQQAQSGYLYVFDDISKEQELEQQLQQAQKMESVGQLAGGIAHDFNNLLGGITGFADLLRINASDEKSQRYAQRILNTAQKAAELTAQLLAFSRRGRISNTHFSLHNIINEACFILERTIDKNVSIDLNLHAQNTGIFGDKSQIENVILNMAINARDAMSDGGTLSISTANEYLNQAYCNSSAETIQPGMFVKICISDTGKGIEPETLTHIFEPFFTTKELGKGTGLGLAAVYGTITGHHGAIHVNSAPGLGSTFTIYLPVSDIELDQDTDASGMHAIKYSGSILVVDDEESVRDFTHNALEHLGYQVDQADCGNEAIEMYKAQPYDLVILDLMMPKMNGQQTLAALRQVDPQIRVLISSGYSSDNELASVQELGIHGFIKKPFKITALCDQVAECLQSSTEA